MLVYLLKRIAAGVVLLAATVTVVFVMLALSGANVARTIVGANASEEQVRAKTTELGLDRPIWDQFSQWALRALQGDLGTSFLTSQGVAETVLQRAGVTLSIVTLSILASALLAVAVGITAALRRGWLDRLLQGVAVLGTALPGFWVALVLITVFAVGLRWLPATGYVRPEQDLAGWAASLVLPVAAISIAGISGSAMQLRSAIIDLSHREFVRTLRSRALPPRRLFLIHLLRNAAPPALTVLSLQFVGMLSGAVVVEEVFALPGIGRLAVSSTASGDIPVVMGVVTLMVTMVVAVNLLLDLANAWLNPKVRMR
ncbi:ABC transporter permease [Microbacterium sp. 18062]|uniref:ABC transporter permease n=1 Tax=Microbacterium sp. 18062 TaxID=2681410 RepID=UPI00135A8026|nr:ABC transporter permease [Microbacterium sp. 18062]